MALFYPLNHNQTPWNHHFTTPQRPSTPSLSLSDQRTRRPSSVAATHAPRSWTSWDSAPPETSTPPRPAHHVTRTMVARVKKTCDHRLTLVASKENMKQTNTRTNEQTNEQTNKETHVHQTWFFKNKHVSAMARSNSLCHQNGKTSKKMNIQKTVAHLNWTNTRIWSNNWLTIRPSLSTEISALPKTPGQKTRKHQTVVGEKQDMHVPRFISFSYRIGKFPRTC